MNEGFVLHGSSPGSAAGVGPGNQTALPRSPCHRNQGLQTVWEPPRESAQTGRGSEVKRQGEGGVTLEPGGGPGSVYVDSGLTSRPQRTPQVSMPRDVLELANMRN